MGREEAMDSIAQALNGDVVGSGFEMSSDGLYSLGVDVESLENKLSVRFDAEKGVMVFEFVWFNFAGLDAPTAGEIVEELEALQDVRDSVADIVEDTPYEFATGVLDSSANNSSSRHPVTSVADCFTPSVLYEGDSMRMSIGIAREDTNTPF